MQPVRQIREMMALAMLAVSSYTDIRQRCIYLVPLIVPAAGAVAISVLCRLSGYPTDVPVYDPAAAILTGVVLVIAVKCFKSYMGSGDGYLIAALGIVIGTNRNLLSVMLALILAAVFSVCIILSGKRSIKSIPFAPFLMAGFILVLIKNV